MKTYNNKFDWWLCKRLQYVKSLSTLHSQVKQQTTNVQSGRNKQPDTITSKGLRSWERGSSVDEPANLIGLLLKQNKCDLVTKQGKTLSVVFEIKDLTFDENKQFNWKMMSKKLQHHQSVLFLTFLFALLLCRNDSKWVAATVTQ